MKQILLIGGATTFSTREAFLDYLRMEEYSAESLLTSDKTWKDTMQEKLGERAQVLRVPMPNKDNAHYEEWKVRFERVTDTLAEDLILVGHSMGGVFLAKYLSENSFDKPVYATILIAPPYNDESLEELASFRLEKVTDKFKEQAGTTIIYAGGDDPVVSYSDCAKYKSVLPEAEFITTSAPDHFVRPEFPELVSRLEALL
jgi:predicted alpha/beta hydrolase family esterase